MNTAQAPMLISHSSGSAAIRVVAPMNGSAAVSRDPLATMCKGHHPL